MFTEGLTEGHIAAPTITDGAYRRFRFWVSRSLEATVAIAAGGAASSIPESDALLDKAKAKAPARSLVSIDDVGVATALLAHDAARLITGETLYVDGGYHIID